MAQGKGKTMDVRVAGTPREVAVADSKTMDAKVARTAREVAVADSSRSRRGDAKERKEESKRKYRRRCDSGKVGDAELGCQKCGCQDHYDG